ncbi:hypothetical protein PENTCL1PPCAC_15391 [Pristionchus entomophagus]|uniref:glucuronosyltransferase n=1 Tax=Pristionchus entomophagus TaxID=358040 RepID=A0AAV5TGY6_9BILA|nr:hypothetical protein PENTCL1PPCAC_15391 [Pristionchus entomophagus]
MRVVLFLLIISLHSHSYKILVYNSKVGYSNVNFYGNIADILVEAGHDVTTLLPEIDPSLSDDTYTSRKIFVKQTAECKHVITFTRWHNCTDQFVLRVLKPSHLEYGTPYSDRFVLQCRGTLEEPGLIDRLRAEKFDVMITENYDMCGIGLSHLIKPKALINGAASVPLAWMFEEFGLPKSWSYNLSPRNSHLDVHSFWSRLKNLYAEAIQYRIFYSSRSLIGKLFNEKYGTDFPSLTEISSHAAYTIINSEPLVDFATPTLNRIVFVGGLGAKEPQKLSKIFDDILNLRSKSVVISFGSIVASHKLKDAVKAVIVETVAKFPHVTFIWKYEEPADDFAKSTMLTVSNLHFFNWIPQNDLLEDRRSTAFITHAGMGSTQEMVISGKPGLFIPCFGDQPRNAAMLERNGLGKVMHLSFSIK